ncbi:hypothetical protein B0J13DRAFT_547310 [Dactylonectria estremocensis]|uniref:Uncharacterized protein n=1 Tax=Dactylonectria estremocensis TaxID=1079267 RepID=A0A9P9F360_9HYPO|nr:hypothetical protein B0J13DRAFT_547310 [Dactylonectria estremocensis]
MYRVIKTSKAICPSHVLAPTNYRRYRLISEEDGIQWFHTETSNIALSAFTRRPELLQTPHKKPFTQHRCDFTADVCYSVSHGGRRKRQWQNGRLTSPQKRLERELRATDIHVYTYVCPQVSVDRESVPWNAP